MRLAVELAGWCRDQRDAPLPARVVAQARRHLLDAVGAGVAGADHRVVRTLAAALDDAGTAPVFADRRGRSPRAAARLNGTAIHALEVDDTEGCDHSAAVVVPALLAAVDAGGRGAVRGSAFVAAMVLGYEVGRRVQSALGGYEAHNARGWHSTATCGVFAATVAAGSVLDLTAAQLASALGVASSAAAGTWAFAADGADTKRLHPGNAAASGLDAALLAAAGVHGPTAVFDRGWGGFLDTHAGTDADPAALLDGLGEVWAFEHSAVKPYASCRSTHAPIDAVRALLDGVPVTSVERIEVEGSALLGDMVFPADVTGPDAARMSLPYCLALLLEGRHLTPAAFEGPADPVLARWLDRVRFTAVDGATEPLVRLVLTDGSSVQARADHTRPLDDAEVLAKFRRLTEGRLSPEEAAVVERTCAGVDRLASVSPGQLVGAPTAAGVSSASAASTSSRGMPSR